MFGHAKQELASLWAALGTHPDVLLKRQLWDGLRREVYGTPVGDVTPSMELVDSRPKLIKNG